MAVIRVAIVPVVPVVGVAIIPVVAVLITRSDIDADARRSYAYTCRSGLWRNGDKT